MPTPKSCLSREAILDWLQEEDPHRLDELWRVADRIRREHVGNAVHLRGLIEISNVCVRRCAYCGIRAGQPRLTRYRMTPGEILACAEKAAAFGYGTVVLQAGEDPLLTGPLIADLVRDIKRNLRLAVTLSLGERGDHDLRLWREAGADRYLLRFETSNRALFEHIHPREGHGDDRLAMLPRLREMGYEIGSGIMCGIPGQSYEDLAEDVLWFARLDLDMIGIGPFIPHPDTPLGREDAPRLPPDQQAPNTEAMTYKLVALARIVCPQANIPSTTALATLNLEEGREQGLQRGANVLMPNLTPTEYRRLYEIYPAKACVLETAEKCHVCMRGRIERIGRTVGFGPGGRARCPIDSANAGLEILR